MPSEKDRLENLTISINKTKANHIQVPTSVATLLPPEGLPGLRTLRQGGEAMSAVLVEKWLSVTNIQNSYGPCECTVSSSIQLYPNPENPGNVGVGVGCFLWIADTMNSSSILNMAPIGAVGELLIQGPLVGRGYINRPDENSRAFIKNCFLPADHPAANFSVYRTGDLARYSEDGSINLLGRKDHQVKIRGQRIELGEIESLLSMQQNLDFAVCDVANTGAFKGLLVSPVQFVKDEKKIGGGEELKILDEALRPGLKQQLREIYRNLEETLPSFMIPILIPVVKFPFLLTGKVDRKSVKHWLNGINLETKTKIEREIMEGEMSSEADCDYAVISRDLAQKISSLIPGEKAQPQADLGFDDFLLKSSGLDSIQTVTLWRLLKDEYRVSIPISVLNNPLLSVKGLAKYITSGAAGDEWEMHQNQNLVLELSSLKSQLRSWTKRFLLRKVFLTGATGYLGSFILKSLLTSSHIGRVIVHVRAPTPKDGLSRVKNSAQLLHWWDEKFISKVEIWTGDLALPRLGLDEQHWQKLTATNDISQIDAIVHCGARVNWTQDYHSLRSVNVLSTLNLLQAFLKSDGSQPLKFVYVSGGCQWSIGEDTDKLLTEQLKTCDNGYGQTKLMSELLVRSAVNGSPNDKLIIMKPSFIIGSPSNGTANVDDFFWRVILSSIQIGLYDEELEESWVFVTSAERIADLVFQGLVGNHDDPGLVVTKAFDGIPLNQLWQILRNDFGYTLHPMKHEAWLKTIHDRIEIEREKHPLWPLSHMIHSDFCRLGCDTSESTPFSNHERMQYVKASFVKSVEYLISIGYLPKTCGKKEEQISVPVFSRSTLTR
ncbi:hypothetical protein BGW36DRAFT_366324 [Talaromyces proteolyticus]|uniref:Carrier domain-containing protein n=1 Tax=Talaromyces proteolyticus TaxID=1131652 RepID=A0AAD4Q5S4_9EURO|nr:uncharacterized protein BGW36DRAFT_366324 [Talaromyces proteolyticus]KAH8704863.1 hypothetical protein BGW36DRAFT_366324 [Talaromyces proteolyticus]